MAFRWTAPLIGIGVSQMLLSVGMIVAGGMSIAACEQLFHISWAVITGGFLFALGATNVSGCKCAPRMLLGLGIINFLMIGVAIAAIASGGIGIRCELSGGKDHKYDGASCYSFAKEIHCVNDRWMADSTTSATSTSKETFKTHRTKGMIINGVVLGTGVILFILCIAAAAVSIRAYGADQANVPPPQIIIQSPQSNAGDADTEPLIGKQVLVEKAQALPGGAASGVNIHNANGGNVSTTMNGGALEMDGRGGTIGKNSARTSSSCQSQPSSRSQHSYSAASNRSFNRSDRSGSSTRSTSASNSASCSSSRFNSWSRRSNT